MIAEVRSELQRLLSSLCDAELSEMEHARMEELLAADPECRRVYLEYIDMNARLLVHPGLGLPGRGDMETGRHAGRETEAYAGSLSPCLPFSSSARARESRSRPRVPPVLGYVVVAGATLAASLLIQSLWWQPATGLSNTPAAQAADHDSRLTDYVATLAQTAACVWENPAEPWRVGSRLQPGEMRLLKGVARIRFDSGSDLVLEGPAALRLNSATAATLLRGKVVFRADKTTAPFDLHTPNSTLEDFGTEFAVAVGPKGEEIHVFDGEVRRLAKTATGLVETEHLKAGEARRYGTSPVAPGQPTELAPAQFVRQFSDPALPPADASSGLLAYEGFDYRSRADFQAGLANGGSGWSGPWTPLFARPLNEGDSNQEVLNVHESLVRPGAALPSPGGSFEYAGFTKYFRRLAMPIRLDDDGVYYVSFLFRRGGPSDDDTNAVAVLLWTTDEYQQITNGKDDPRKRLNIGVRGWNQLFTHLHDVGSRVPLPLNYGETYLLVAKIVASGFNPDQVFMRVYGPEEPIELEEPGSWSVVGQPFQSDLVFDWLQLHINSKARQTIDELRLGTTWTSVTAPWRKP